MCKIKDLKQNDSKMKFCHLDSWGLRKIQGVPKKMFPCLRGYNSCKKGATVKSKVSFEILRQFSFWWALKFLHLDHKSLRKWGLKIATLLLKLWQKQPSSDLNFLATLRGGSPCIFFTLVEVNENLTPSIKISILKFVVKM